MNFTITPFTIFLVMFIILIIFTMMCNSFTMREGLISFYKDGNSLTEIHVPQYNDDEDVKLTKLYDNLYFDTVNANLVEI